MKKIIFPLAFGMAALLSVLVGATQATSTQPSLLVTPSAIEQGEPVLITIEGTPFSRVRSIVFGGRKLSIFAFKGKASALAAIDLHGNPGTVRISASISGSADASGKLSAGQSLSATLLVTARPKVQSPLGIPAELGGDTVSSQKNLVSSLANENAILASLKSTGKSLWTELFRFPLAVPVVSDPYGYSRQTGGYSISHLGTDFHADEGTPVFAMNKGTVRLAKQYRVYGKMVVIDHGFGLMTMYLHLSKLNVKEGQLVSAGQEIGLSGSTGYAASPHLHLSVRIQGVSIDPMKFMELMH